VQRFTPLVVEAAGPCRHSVGDGWFVDETYVKVAGVWRYVYRAVDQHCQVIDVYVSKRRNIAAVTRFFETMLLGRDRPREVTTDLAAPLLRVVDDLLPDVVHDTTQYAIIRVEWDHGRLKSRLGPMRGLRTDATHPSIAQRNSAVSDGEPYARRSLRWAPERDVGSRDAGPGCAWCETSGMAVGVGE
jgi:IS6 family transposase